MRLWAANPIISRHGLAPETLLRELAQSHSVIGHRGVPKRKLQSQQPKPSEVHRDGRHHRGGDLLHHTRGYNHPAPAMGSRPNPLNAFQDGRLFPFRTEKTQNELIKLADIANPDYSPNLADMAQRLDRQ